MTGINKTQFSIWAAFMVASVGTAIAASGAVQAGNGPAQCEIFAQNSGSMVAIEALAHASEAMSGSYILRISGPGTSLTQGGDFEAAAGDSVTLGSAMLTASGSVYDVQLEISSDGTSAQCSKRVGSV